MSFYVTAFKGAPSSDTYDYEALPDNFCFTGGSEYLGGPITLQKKAE